MAEVEEGARLPADCGGGPPAGPSWPPHSGFYSLLFSSFQGALSRTEASFTREGVAYGVRADGRGLTEPRPRKLACGLLPLSCGSAAIQTDDNTVIVTADVRRCFCHLCPKTPLSIIVIIILTIFEQECCCCCLIACCCGTGRSAAAGGGGPPGPLQHNSRVVSLGLRSSPGVASCASLNCG